MAPSPPLASSHPNSCVSTRATTPYFMWRPKLRSERSTSEQVCVCVCVRVCLWLCALSHCFARLPSERVSTLRGTQPCIGICSAPNGELLFTDQRAEALRVMHPDKEGSGGSAETWMGPTEDAVFTSGCVDGNTFDTRFSDPHNL